MAFTELTHMLESSTPTKHLLVSHALEDRRKSKNQIDDEIEFIDICS